MQQIANRVHNHMWSTFAEVLYTVHGLASGRRIRREFLTQRKPHTTNNTRTYWEQGRWNQYVPLLVSNLNSDLWILLFVSSFPTFNTIGPGVMHAVHDDVIKWKYFPRYWPFVWGIHRWPVNFPHKGRWRGALIFSLICAWINAWVNNREAADFRRHRAHYDAIVMHFPLYFSHTRDKPVLLNITRGEADRTVEDFLRSHRLRD